MARLVHLDRLSSSTDLVGGEMLGRSRGCSVRVLDPRVSRRHAVIVEMFERFLLLDVGSTHGTWVNGRRVKEADLRHGDTIQIGDTRMQFLDEASDEAPLALGDDRLLSPRARRATYRFTHPDRSTLFDDDETTAFEGIRTDAGWSASELQLV